MTLTKRDFLKISVASVGAVALSGLPALASADAYVGKRIWQVHFPNFLDEGKPATLLIHKEPEFVYPESGTASYREWMQKDLVEHESHVFFAYAGADHIVDLETNTVVYDGSDPTTVLQPDPEGWAEYDRMAAEEGLLV